MKLAPYPGAKAVARAKSYVGKKVYSGMCQAFTVTMFGTGAVGDYDGDRDADAVDGWEKSKRKGKVVLASAIKDFTKIPAGVALYWSGGSRGYGHAAVSIGGGQMVTTDRSGGKVGVAPIKGWWTSSHRFLGYVLVEGNGYTLLATEPSTDRDEPSAYFIGAKGDHITWIRGRLLAHGVSNYGSGTVFNDIDRAAVATFQKKQGWTGSDADGLPGPETLRRLEAEPVPKPAPNPKPTPIPEQPQPPKGKLVGRIITYNIRGANHDPAASDPHHWSKRRAKVLSVINNETPSIVCLQEVNTAAQVADIDEGLADALDYWSNRGRNFTWIDDKAKTGKFKVHDVQDFQLTAHQDRRMQLLDATRIDAGIRFWLVNTHAPSGSDSERTKFAKALVTRIPKDGRPAVICIDANKEQVTKTTLRGIIEAAGFKRLEQVDPQMVNQHIDSYNAFQPPTSDRLDADEIYLRGFKAGNSELVLAAQGVSDHYAKVTTLYV